MDAPLFGSRGSGRDEESYHDHRQLDKKIAQFPHGASAMGYGVFLVGAHLGKAFAGFSGDKDGVVAESAVTPWFAGDGSINSPFEYMRPIRGDKGHGGGEMCIAVLRTLHVGEKFFHVCLRIMPGAGISRAVHAGCTAEGVDHQSGVVGEAVHTVTVVDPAGFHKSIPLECIGGLRDIVVTAYFLKRDNVNAVAHDAACFLEFMLVVGCEYKSFHITI